MRGRGQRAGPARGPRARAGKTGRVGRPVGLAGRPTSSFPFSVFHFFFIV